MFVIYNLQGLAHLHFHNLFFNFNIGLLLCQRFHQAKRLKEIVKSSIASES